MNRPLLFLVLLFVTSGSAMAWEEGPRSGKFFNPYINKPVQHSFTWDRTSVYSWESPGSRWSSDLKKTKSSKTLGNKPSCYISSKTLKKLKEAKKVIPKRKDGDKKAPPKKSPKKEKENKEDKTESPEPPTHKVSDSGSTLLLLLGALLMAGVLKRRSRCIQAG